jgi:hypothetical protein
MNTLKLMSWKTWAGLAVGLLLLLTAARSFTAGGGSGQNAIDTTGATRGSTPATAQAPPQSAPPTQAPQPKASPAGKRATAKKKTTVVIDGKAIPAGGQPTILLNPGLVRPGTKVGVSGYGFDAGAAVNVLVKSGATDKGETVATAKADQNGSISVSFTVPDSLGNSNAQVVAQQVNSDKAAHAAAVVPAGIGSIKLSKEVGKPGDVISVNVKGFSPSETINVFWGRISGDPAQQLKADGGGGVSRAEIKVGVAAVGSTVLVLVGDKSQTVATAPFTMLGLYPTVDVAPYAVKAVQRLGFSGKGFAPGERVLVYINSTDAQPVMNVQADEQGNFGDAGFVVPFGLNKSQSLILIGEQSRSVVSSGFEILPYTPSAQPSTYGGFPGTTLSFYANGFGPNEVVLVYAGRTQNNPGELVSAFRVDGNGNAAAAGSYMIPGNAQGKLSFGLVGRQSQATASASINVQHSDVPVQLPPPVKYELPAELQQDATDASGQPAATSSTSGAKGNPAGKTASSGRASQPAAPSPLPTSAVNGSASGSPSAGNGWFAGLVGLFHHLF